MNQTISSIANHLEPSVLKRQPFRFKCIGARQRLSLCLTLLFCAALFAAAELMIPTNAAGNALPNTATVNDPCQGLLNQLNTLKDERAMLQADLQQAEPGQKAAIAAQIKALNAKIAKAEADYLYCRETTDVVDYCPNDATGDRANYPDPKSYYRLPFTSDPAWVLGKGNWDDPKAGHCKPDPGKQFDPTCLQAYAFDFDHPVNGLVLAARPGKVVDFTESEKGNSIEDRNVYLFKGDKFMIYDSYGDKVVQGYKPISQGINNWPAAWANGFDDAVNWENGKIYCFKGPDYLRLDVATKTVDAGYPKSILGHWGNWPQSWATGIDAVYNWRGDAYFFKDGEWMVYNFATDKRRAGPFPLSVLKGWPAAWLTGVDAAMVGGGGGLGKVTFFRGTQVMRYDIVSKQVDIQPTDIALAKWLTLPAQSVDGAVRWNGGYSGVGNYLVIEHADGTFGVYFHLSQNGVMVNPQEQVHRGQVLALSGHTGSSFGPHLHFDVRQGWDLGYSHTNWNEFHSVPIKFQDYNHNCWIPRVGEVLSSNNY